MLTSAYVIACLYLFFSHSEISGTAKLIYFGILTPANRRKMFTSHILSILLFPSHSSFTCLASLSCFSHFLVALLSQLSKNYILRPGFCNLNHPGKRLNVHGVLLNCEFTDQPHIKLSSRYNSKPRALLLCVSRYY